MEDGSLPRRFQYQISIHSFWHRFNTSSATFLEVTLPLVPISPHAVATPCHHFVTRITACLLAELPGFLRNIKAAPPISSLRSIGGGSAYFHGVSSPPSAPTCLSLLLGSEILSPGIIIGAILFSSSLQDERGGEQGARSTRMRWES